MRFFRIGDGPLGQVHFRRIGDVVEVHPTANVSGFVFQIHDILWIVQFHRIAPEALPALGFALQVEPPFFLLPRDVNVLAVGFFVGIAPPIAIDRGSDILELYGLFELAIFRMTKVNQALLLVGGLIE